MSRTKIRKDPGVVRARNDFGGIDVPATLAGTLAALGTAVLLGGLLAGAGSFGYQQGIEDQDLSLGGLIAGLVTLLVSFLVGGWVAGRMARYDGGRNGLMTALWFVVLAAIAGALGAWAGSEYDVFSDVQLPQWFSDDATSWQAIVSGAVALVVMFVAGFLGGKRGEAYHRKADRLIVDTHDEMAHAERAHLERDRLAGTEGDQVVGRGSSDLDQSRSHARTERG
jgi:hypothetical protein